VTLVVFDIDGVVADVRHRLRYLEDYPQDWDSFFYEAVDDPSLQTGIDLVRKYQADGHEIAWLTGRPEWLRPETESWMREHELPIEELVMRPDWDFRPARILKVEVLQAWRHRDIVLFIDDDPDVIAQARLAGFNTQMATWVPHGKTLRAAQEDSGRT
jgi:FMN phosphatase YigB (HAD superfamily)